MNKLTLTLEVTDFSDPKFQAVMSAISSTGVKPSAAKVEDAESPKPEAQKQDAKPKSKPETPKEAKETKAEKPSKSVETESEVSISAIRALLSEKVGENRDAIKSKLSTFGASNLTSLSEDSYEEFYEFLNSL